MSKTFYDMAKRYYEEGRWNKDMIDSLYAKGRLTEEEYNNIIGENE